MSVWIINDRYFVAPCFVFLSWRMPVWGWSTCVFLLGDKHIFKNKFQSEHPLRKGLFIWQNSLWSHMRNYIKREAPDRAGKKKKKDSLRLWPRWRNRLFPTYLVWWPWKLHIQWGLSAKQAHGAFLAICGMWWLHPTNQCLSLPKCAIPIPVNCLSH